MRPVIIAPLLVWALVGPASEDAAAQPSPPNPFITAAADKINSITPQAVPRQTIRVGTYDGAANKFEWLLPEAYPATLPQHKREDQGGPVPPDHLAAINSFNVTYEFNLRNTGPGFRLTLRTPDSTGKMVEKEATTVGNVASVSFNPYSFARQTVTISGSGTTAVSITPVLQPQLGSFVVPQLLLAIVYEPFGVGVNTYASFGERNTASSSVSWGFERAGGLVQEVALDDFTKALEAVQGAVKGVDAAAAVLNGMFGVAPAEMVSEIASAVGNVLDVIHTVMGQTAQVTTTQGQSSGQETGVSISVEVGVQTSVENGNQYPGADDRFVHLHDVLYVYMVLGRKVVLAPVSYGSWHAPTAALLQQELPQIAPHWIALDPLLSGSPIATRAPSLVTQISRRPGPGAPERFERPQWLPAFQCEQSGPNYVEMKEEQFRTLSTGRTTTRTTLIHAHGFSALLGDDDETVESVTYSNSAEHSQAQATVARVKAQCAPGAEYWIEPHVDKAFRTLLPMRGEPVSPQAFVAGTVSDPAGRPAARQRVILNIGGRSYAVVSDGQGNFRFRLASLPRGQGVLMVGGRSAPIAFAGTPITGLRLQSGR